MITNCVYVKIWFKFEKLFPFLERSESVCLAPKSIKKPKKVLVIKKSRTFAAENEYYLFT